MAATLQQAWAWLEGKKTKIGGGILCLGAIVGVALKQLTVSDGMMLFGAGAAIFGAADKANRHQQQILQVLTTVAQARTLGIAGEVKTLLPIAIADAAQDMQPATATLVRTPAPPVTGATASVLLLFALLALGASTSARAQQPAPDSKYCAAQLPFGAPAPAKQVICRKGYALDYDSTAKIPVWDAHVLTPSHSFGCVPRSNAFAADQSLPADERAKPSDYLHSGYDIGHMSPDADFTYDEQLERQTFYLTNMAPQLPGLNRQTWKYLEEDLRAWAHSGPTLWIITGPVYSAGGKTIGDDAVVVPTAFWKVIVDEKAGTYVAFLMPQEEGLGSDLGKFVVSLRTVEKASGVRIPLPAGARPASFEPADEKAYRAAEKAGCR